MLENGSRHTNSIDFLGDLDSRRLKVQFRKGDQDFQIMSNLDLVNYRSRTFRPVRVRPTIGKITVNH